MRVQVAQAARLLFAGALLSCVSTAMAQTNADAIAPEPGMEANRASTARDSADARMEFKSLADVKLDLVARAQLLPSDSSNLAFNGSQSSGPFSPTMTEFHWEAANFFHRPLYFDDTPLERYGQSVCPPLQPVISGTRFFLTFPVLPYKMGVDRPLDCVTSYGLYRPGNCAPCVREVLPRGEKDAVVFQTATTLGWIFLLP
ncbi:MAG: hypothetical protein KDB23_31440 [Planctomycetales bacterium]|nr:hypothetical protein [Planctomycetales bacterium]